MIIDFTIPQIVIQFVLICAVYIALAIYISFFTRRLLPTILSSALGLAIILLFLFKCDYLFYIGVATYAIFVVLVGISNIFGIRTLFIRRFKGKREKVSKNDTSISKIFNKNEVWGIVLTTVKKFSKTKTGAIITFERDNDLKPLMKNGVILNAPVNQELLETIFYEGTRLHDGAVIIKDDKVLAASVYYTLTTRPLSGKYGSRHRAAIGISEISDSVTIVVSEETGRISIASGGNIESVSIENLDKVFFDMMEEEN